MLRTAAAAILLLAVGLAGCGTAEAPAGPPAGINWATDVPDNGTKPVFLYFTADWCPPCKTMKLEVWPDATIAATMEQYDAVYIDTDERPDLGGRYGVPSIPTMVVLAPDGTERDRRVGLASVKELTAWLDRHAKG
jgi:thioredoxin-like negative regulator of GroEL